MRAVKGRAVYDSSAWHSTSNPLAAITMGGSVRVAVGSTSASDGRSRREAIPVFALSSRSSNTAMPVHSLPVPHVVGHATSGGSGPGTARPSPTGALKYARSSAGYFA